MSEKQKQWPDYGCHVDLFDAPDGKPDDCVLSYGAPSDCMHGHTSPGRPRRHPHTCRYWRPNVTRILQAIEAQQPETPGKDHP